MHTSKIIWTLGILSVTVNLKCQNLEISKNWLKEDRKVQLKTNVVLESEYLKLPITESVFRKEKAFYKEEKDKYSVSYLNSSIKEELKYMSVTPPALSSGGVGAVIGGLDLSNPKSYFEAGTLRKRYRKMKQITTYVYPIE